MLFSGRRVIMKFSLVVFDGSLTDHWGILPDEDDREPLSAQVQFGPDQTIQKE